MGSFINLILVLSLGYAALLLTPLVHGWLGGTFLVATPGSDPVWLVVLDWVPRLFTGLVLGIVIALFARGENPHYWAMLAGLLLAAGAWFSQHGSWSLVVPQPQLPLQQIWPLMYLAGAAVGGPLITWMRRTLDESRDAPPPVTDDD